LYIRLLIISKYNILSITKLLPRQKTLFECQCDLC